MSLTESASVPADVPVAQDLDQDQFETDKQVFWCDVVLEPKEVQDSLLCGIDISMCAFCYAS